jgi:uncharacterized membrane protein YfcA
MLPRTLFLSKLIGLYCILIALSMMTRRQATVETVTVLLQNPSMTLILGIITLAAGLAMVLAHNIWSGGDRHPRRLGNADQEPVFFVPVAGGGSGLFPSAASLPRTFLRVRSYFTCPRHLPDL